MNKKIYEPQTSSFWSNLFKNPTEMDELEDILLSMPPFRELKEKPFYALLELVHNRAYEENEYVFYQGDPGIGLYIILDGEISISQQFSSGKKFEITQLTKGDFFGEVALLDDETRSASAITTRKSKLAVIFKPDLDEYMNKYPKDGVKILRGISQIIAKRLRTMNQDYYNIYTSNIILTKEEL
ncbi:MAG: cyclic nucleotide-binding domain-containing protein [Melioribacteraceae bacterium]